MLEEFIVRAKSATYIGGGNKSATPTRTGSHDLGYRDGDWHYIDSYFGGTDFIGQEVVWHQGTAMWAMNYHGRILRPDMIDATTAGMVIQRSLSTLYREGRFLGGFTHPVENLVYVDTNAGEFQSFTGVERIYLGHFEAYRLDYHGGIIKP
ncbi:DUF5680 domain-containing protein [Agrobacterium pusense]|jgi:hypothetical protein|uniref:DUF5680 domain-containing protein n=1 Tax=Agrobacterium pusense TaxID=648995 RepID=UPI0005EDC3CC|nr:DUF5680 domain-containing protein [Agrobacterium pusense]PZU78797.1 MAG: hypothetical protein DI546_02290 [Rhizobium sp.]TGR66876.1 hypothetical protein EN837_17610 [bacterium M00.F.Ca.ET.194.01.1.1]TGS53423.1 hypothetical protein EN822_17605 [bacterium M00.F.Ca.ET.179.01.1.1]TGV46184.1 hypothetical protein EN811_17610 [bacterium M00.F.Ca.ET.168.01.1.1]MBW9057527.1 hypothetical protein [Agrobacterium pusense]